MAEFIVQCPACGFSFSTDESHVGFATVCANCANEFNIQSEEPDGSKSSQRLRPDQILVTSGDIHSPYEHVGMVCFTVGTRGEMREHFDSLKNVVAHKLETAKSQGQVSASKNVGQLVGGIGVDSSGNISLQSRYAGASFRSNDLEIAFHIAVNQLQLRANFLNANAIIWFRYEVDFDSNASVLNFMATAYGTAVRTTS